MHCFTAREPPSPSALALAAAAYKSQIGKELRPAGSLYVAIYTQAHSLENHWALYLREPTRHTIFQVSGARPALLAPAHLHNTRPSSSALHRENIRVVHIYDAEQVERVHDLAYLQRRPDHTQGENCQDWVLALLRALVAEGVVAARDYDEMYDILLAKKSLDMALDASGLGRKARAFYTRLSEWGPEGL